MARIARVVVPHCPHHVVQRGGRRQQVFFGDGDYRLYLALLAEQCRKHDVAVWAYCLMPNHVHLIAVPSTAEGFARAIAEAHRRYARQVNTREGWQGHLWQERFGSFVMDEAHLLAAARYVELNPVRAGLARRAADYAWSSAKAHLAGKDDALVEVAPLLKLAGDWRAFLREPLEEAKLETIRSHGRTGRPLGAETFVARLEKSLDRTLRRQKPGPKPKGK